MFEFHIFFTFYAISNIFSKKNSGWRGKKNGKVKFKNIKVSDFISRFMLFPTFKKNDFFEK